MANINHKTDTKTLIEAMRTLSREIQSEDGVANAAIYEAADIMEYQEKVIKQLNDQNKLEKYGKLTSTASQEEMLQRKVYILRNEMRSLLDRWDAIHKEGTPTKNTVSYNIIKNALKEAEE